MTPDPGTTHLDLDALADALAGEPHPHLSDCASCTSRLAELEAAEARVVASLRALPAPAMPDDLPARLSAAFAAESPLAAAAAAPAAAGNVTALPERAPRRRFLPAAAAAVLLASGGGLGYALLTGGSSSDDTASMAAGDAGAESTGSALPTSSTGTDYADAAAVGAVLPAVLAGGAAGVAADSTTTMAAPAAPPVGGTAPSAALPPEEARASVDVSATAAAPASDPLARLRTPGGLEECLSAVLPPEEPDLRPSALDYATYQGQPALAIVLPDPDPAKLSVFVVGADCAAADARVLSFLRVDAP